MARLQRTLLVAFKDEDTDESNIPQDAFVDRDLLVVATEKKITTDEQRGHFSATGQFMQYFVLDGFDITKTVSVVVSGNDGKGDDPDCLKARFPSTSFHLSKDTSQSVQADLAALGIALEAERTLCIVKPDGMPKARDIFDRLKSYGFQRISTKRLQLLQRSAQEFYIEHEGRSFFERLVKHMTSGPIFVVCLERVGAILGWRQLLGPTNTHEARKTRPNCIRALFGTDQTRNACHGSDSPESAAREIDFFFPELTEQDFRGIESLVKEAMNGKEALGNSESCGLTPDNFSLNEILTKSLKELYEKKPENPITWLANRLLEQAPSSIISKAEQ